MNNTIIIDIAIALIVTIILYKVIKFIYHINFSLWLSPTKRRELKVQQFMNSYILCKKKEIVEQLVLSKKELSYKTYLDLLFAEMDKIYELCYAAALVTKTPEEAHIEACMEVHQYKDAEFITDFIDDTIQRATIEFSKHDIDEIVYTPYDDDKYSDYITSLARKTKYGDSTIIVVNDDYGVSQYQTMQKKTYKKQTAIGFFFMRRPFGENLAVIEKQFNAAGFNATLVPVAQNVYWADYYSEKIYKWGFKLTTLPTFVKQPFEKEKPKLVDCYS